MATATAQPYRTGFCGTRDHDECRRRWAGPCACTCGHPEPVLSLTAVSLFAGVGGIDLALQRAGVRVVAAVEIDPVARAVLQRRFPDATVFEDVREVTGDQLRAAGFVPDRGLLVAGWPCQDNSVAGRRAGMAGARSGLWVHVARLLAELHPAWFLGENVPGLLSVNDGRDFAAVIGDVADSGMGCAWRVLDAQYFGVPQRRRRVFIVGCAGNRAAPVQVLFEPEGGGGDPAPRPAAGSRVAAITASSAGSGCGADDNDAQGGRLIVSTLDDHNVITHTLTSEGFDASEDGSGRGTPLVPTMTAVRRLTPLECERLQGLPDGWTTPQADSPRYRQIGNSVAVPAVEWVVGRVVVVDRALGGAA